MPILSTKGSYSGATPEPAFTVEAPLPNQATLALSPDGPLAYAGDHLLVQNGAGNLEVWSEDGSEHQLTIEDSGFGAITGSPDGTLAASVGSEDGEIHLIDLETGAEVANFERLSTSPTFGPDSHSHPTASGWWRSWKSLKITRRSL